MQFRAPTLPPAVNTANETHNGTSAAYAAGNQQAMYTAARNLGAGITHQAGRLYRWLFEPAHEKFAKPSIEDLANSRITSFRNALRHSKTLKSDASEVIAVVVRRELRDLPPLLKDSVDNLIYMQQRFYNVLRDDLPPRKFTEVIGRIPELYPFHLERWSFAYFPDKNVSHDELRQEGAQLEPVQEKIFIPTDKKNTVMHISIEKVLDAARHGDAIASGMLAESWYKKILGTELSPKEREKCLVYCWFFLTQACLQAEEDPRPEAAVIKFRMHRSAFGFLYMHAFRDEMKIISEEQIMQRVLFHALAMDALAPTPQERAGFKPLLDQVLAQESGQKPKPTSRTPSSVPSLPDVKTSLKVLKEELLLLGWSYHSAPHEEKEITRKKLTEAASSENATASLKLAKRYFKRARKKASKNPITRDAINEDLKWSGYLFVQACLQAEYDETFAEKSGGHLAAFHFFNSKQYHEAKLVSDSELALRVAFHALAVRERMKPADYQQIPADQRTALEKVLNEIDQGNYDISSGLSLRTDLPAVEFPKVKEKPGPDNDFVKFFADYPHLLPHVRDCAGKRDVYALMGLEHYEIQMAQQGSPSHSIFRGVVYLLEAMELNFEIKNILPHVLNTLCALVEMNQSNDFFPHAKMRDVLEKVTARYRIQPVFDKAVVERVDATIRYLRKMESQRQFSHAAHMGKGMYKTVNQASADVEAEAARKRDRNRIEL